MARIFLSYAREDAPRAQELAKAISDDGHEVWWDRNIQGGSRFATEIDRELKNADAVVVLWSKSSVNSAWVQDEAAEGRDTGRLIPLTLDGSKAPLGFRQYQSIDLSHWRGQGAPNELQELLKAIAKVAGEERRGSVPHERGSEDAGVRRKLSVCVLPFINMSGDVEQDYFSDGISEDIITDLSKVSALFVTARNTAFAFKGKAIDLKEVARSLDVSHVLEGSVRKAGTRVRITAQLVDGEAGNHIWGERYDRDLTDIFAIQDEISKAIVSALQLKLLPEEKEAIEQRGTTNAKAYNYYLMARQHWVSGRVGDIRRDEAVVRLCHQATLLDAEYAEAWALMALAQCELRFWHGKQDNALPAAERALSINSSLPEAHCVRARFLEHEGQHDEAQKQIEIALRLNPESWEVNREAARLMFRQGETRRAIPFFEKATALMESDFNNPSVLKTCYNAIGDSEGVRRAAKVALGRAETAVAQDPMNGAALAAGATALAALGETQRSKEWIDRALLLDPDNLTMRYNLGCALTTYLQDGETALDILEPFFEQVNSLTHLRHLEADPDWASVRNHPRFTKMLTDAKNRLGASEA